MTKEEDAKEVILLDEPYRVQGEISKICYVETSGGEAETLDMQDPCLYGAANQRSCSEVQDASLSSDILCHTETQISSTFVVFRWPKSPPKDAITQ